MSLRLEEFIRRLRLHLLPPRFVKIRHYGLLGNRGRQARLRRVRALLGVQELATVVVAERTLPKCPHCGWAALILVGVIPPLRWQTSPVIDTS